MVTLNEQNLWVYEHVCKRFSWLGYLMWEDILRTFPFRGNKLSAITHCSLGLDSGCNVTIFLSSWCLGFPTMMEEYLELWAKANLSLLSCLCQNILSQQQKETKPHSIWELYNYFNLSLLNKFEDSINISTLQKKGLNLKTQTHALVSWIQSAWSSAVVLCSI